jgi:hypothetical protein
MKTLPDNRDVLPVEGRPRVVLDFPAARLAASPVTHNPGEDAFWARAEAEAGNVGNTSPSKRTKSES